MTNHNLHRSGNAAERYLAAIQTNFSTSAGAINTNKNSIHKRQRHRSSVRSNPSPQPSTPKSEQKTAPIQSRNGSSSPSYSRKSDSSKDCLRDSAFENEEMVAGEEFSKRTEAEQNNRCAKDRSQRRLSRRGYSNTRRPSHASKNSVVSSTESRDQPNQLDQHIQQPQQLTSNHVSYDHQPLTLKEQQISRTETTRHNKQNESAFAPPADGSYSKMQTDSMDGKGYPFQRRPLFQWGGSTLNKDLSNVKTEDGESDEMIDPPECISLNCASYAAVPVSTCQVGNRTRDSNHQWRRNHTSNDRHWIGISKVSEKAENMFTEEYRGSSFHKVHTTNGNEPSFDKGDENDTNSDSFGYLKIQNNVHNKGRQYVSATSMGNDVHKNSFVKSCREEDVHVSAQNSRKFWQSKGDPSTFVNCNGCSPSSPIKGWEKDYKIDQSLSITRDSTIDNAGCGNCSKEDLPAIPQHLQGTQQKGRECSSYFNNNLRYTNETDELVPHANKRTKWLEPQSSKARGRHKPQEMEKKRADDLPNQQCTNKQSQIRQYDVNYQDKLEKPLVFEPEPRSRFDPPQEKHKVINVYVTKLQRLSKVKEVIENEGSACLQQRKIEINKEKIISVRSRLRSSNKREEEDSALDRTEDSSLKKGAKFASHVELLYSDTSENVLKKKDASDQGHNSTKQDVDLSGEFAIVKQYLNNMKKFDDDKHGKKLSAKFDENEVRDTTTLVKENAIHCNHEIGRKKPAVSSLHLMNSSSFEDNLPNTNISCRIDSITSTVRRNRVARMAVAFSAASQTDNRVDREEETVPPFEKDTEIKNKPLKLKTFPNDVSQVDSFSVEKNKENENTVNKIFNKVAVSKIMMTEKASLQSCIGSKNNSSYMEKYAKSVSMCQYGERDEDIKTSKRGGQKSIKTRFDKLPEPKTISYQQSESTFFPQRKNAEIETILNSNEKQIPNESAMSEKKLLQFQTRSDHCPTYSKVNLKGMEEEEENVSISQEADDDKQTSSIGVKSIRSRFEKCYVKHRSEKLLLTRQSIGLVSKEEVKLFKPPTIVNESDKIFSFPYEQVRQNSAEKLETNHFKATMIVRPSVQSIRSKFERSKMLGAKLLKKQRSLDQSDVRCFSVHDIETLQCNSEIINKDKKESKHEIDTKRVLPNVKQCQEYNHLETIDKNIEDSRDGTSVESLTSDVKQCNTKNDEKGSLKDQICSTARLMEMQKQSVDCPKIDDAHEDDSKRNKIDSKSKLMTGGLIVRSNLDKTSDNFFKEKEDSIPDCRSIGVLKENVPSKSVLRGGSSSKSLFDVETERLIGNAEDQNKHIFDEQLSKLTWRIAEIDGNTGFPSLEASSFEKLNLDRNMNAQSVNFTDCIMWKTPTNEAPEQDGGCKSESLQEAVTFNSDERNRDKCQIISEVQGVIIQPGTHNSYDDDECDGVTLSPISSVVSSLSIPSCLLDSEMSIDSNSSSDEDTGAMESATEKQSSAKGPSEASSSQTSEAATPLIHSTLGTLNMKLGISSISDESSGFEAYSKRLLDMFPSAIDESYNDELSQSLMLQQSHVQIPFKARKSSNEPFGAVSVEGVYLEKKQRKSSSTKEIGEDISPFMEVDGILATESIVDGVGTEPANLRNWAVFPKTRGSLPSSYQLGTKTTSLEKQDKSFVAKSETYPNSLGERPDSFKLKKLTFIEDKSTSSPLAPNNQENVKVELSTTFKEEKDAASLHEIPNKNTRLFGRTHPLDNEKSDFSQTEPNNRSSSLRTCQSKKVLYVAKNRTAYSGVEKVTRKCLGMADKTASMTKITFSTTGKVVAEDEEFRLPSISVNKRSPTMGRRATSLKKVKAYQNARRQTFSRP